VLIVDDHAPFRRFARRVLDAGGFRVVGEAADGAGTLTAVDDLHPEIVLLDVVLPDLDGITVAHRLARLSSRPLVVLTSSREASELGERLEGAPVCGFIRKDDLSPAALIAACAELR